MASTSSLGQIFDPVNPMWCRNHLAASDEETSRRLGHTHVSVHETEHGNELITIYDCASQKPPFAQLIGTLVRVEAAHEIVSQPTSYITTLREPAVLKRQIEALWIVRNQKFEQTERVS